MSLVEVLVAMTIMSIGVLGFISSFGYIAKSIRVSRARTLATNLAQEKIENLKNESYYKLSLSTVTVTDPNLPDIIYDANNYPIETISIGGINFRRAVLVSMAQVSGGFVTSVGYNFPDTGMKMITVYVMWQQDTTWKRILLENVYENPVVDPLSGQVDGTVTDGTNPIEAAIVRVVENADWSDTTAADGTYLIAAQPGNYSLRASSAGYYDQLITGVNLSSTTSPPRHFTLTPIGTGTISGYVWTNPNLLISHIATSTKTVIANGVQNTQVEFIQLFNPTTYPIDIGSDAGGPATKINYYGEQASGSTDKLDMLTDGAYTNYVSTYVPSLKHYLIASTSYFWFGDQYINADAHYNGIKMVYNNAGSLQIVRASDNHVWDLVGWDDWSGANSSRFYEGNPLARPTSAGGNPPQCNMDGIGEGWSAVRLSTPADVNDTWGPAYDSGNNDLDFLSPSETCLLISTAIAVAGLRNTSFSASALLTGVPMYNAYVTADDLLGPATGAYEVSFSSGIFGTTVTLTSKLAYFQLDGVSTGTWTVIVASDDYSASISTVIVTQNVSTAVVNGITSPLWKVEGYPYVHLETMSTDGYISGVVTDVSGKPVSGIEVLAAGTSKTTGVNGRYFVKVTSGSVFVISNPNNSNPQYVESIEAATVETGSLTSVDFSLNEGGVITGFVSTDGTSILPNVQVAATIAGAQYGLATSDESGNFYIKNLSTGNYAVAPILDPLETYSPLSTSAYVTPGTTVNIGTFTISGSLGTLSGSVILNGQIVTSGALILVSEDAIPNTPTQIIASSSPAQTPIYAASSLAAGGYSVEVRGSTSTTYNVSVYVPTISGTSVTTTTKTYSGVTITAGTVTPLDITVP